MPMAAEAPLPPPPGPMLRFRTFDGPGLGPSEVLVWPDRVEYDNRTIFGKDAGSQTIPIRSITGVEVDYDGKSLVLYRELRISCSGNVSTFSVMRGDANKAKALLSELMLSGSPAPAPPPPAPPAGWYPDPQGQAAQRWWDGSAWTGHTA